LRRAIVGSSAKEDESNLVSVEVMDPDVNEKTSFPLVYLSKGKESQASIDYSFPEIEELGVTFKLEEGSGPVHLVGYHFVERVPGDYSDADEEEVGEEEEEDDEMNPEHVIETAQIIKAALKGKRRLLDDVEESVTAPKKAKDKANGSGAGKNGAVENEAEPAQAVADK